MCIHAQLRHTTDIHEPRKKRDQLLFEYIEIMRILNYLLTDSKEAYFCSLRICQHKEYAMLEHGNYTEILYDVYERSIL